VYESITLRLSGINCGDRIWSLALACPLCLGRPLANVEHSPGGMPFDSRPQLIMSDLQTIMGDDRDILQMIVCLRDGKEAVEQLKAIYPQ
jgi:hypothetical protein